MSHPSLKEKGEVSRGGMQNDKGGWEVRNEFLFETRRRSSGDSTVLNRSYAALVAYHKGVACRSSSSFSVRQWTSIRRRPVLKYHLMLVIVDDQRGVGLTLAQRVLHAAAFADRGRLSKQGG